MGLSKHSEMVQPVENNFANDYLANLLSGNRVQCSQIVKQYLSQNDSILDLYEHVIKTALYKVGRLWETNKISVASEHMATAISEGILNELFERIISLEKVQKKVVVACVENEKHQVGIKMVADTFEMNGWESFFLGAGIPLHELVKYITEIEPDILAISLSVYFNYFNLTQMLDKIQAEFPGLQIIIGGQAFSHLEKQVTSQYKNISLIPDLYYLEKYIRFLNSKN